MTKLKEMTPERLERCWERAVEIRSRIDDNDPEAMKRWRAFAKAAQAFVRQTNARGTSFSDDRKGLFEQDGMRVADVASALVVAEIFAARKDSAQRDIAHTLLSTVDRMLGPPPS